MHWIYIVLTGAFVALQHQAHGSGVFELRLKSFDNMDGRSDLGLCCNGKSETSSKCRGTCRTRFRVCLKHYQATIDDSPCTFGDVVTPILGGNSINMLESRQEGFINPIQFPFDFTWPGWFSLIVEALHDTNETSKSNGVLISRLSTQRLLDIGDKWTEDVKQTSYSVMRYEFRVTCDAHYYGAGCENLCRPRDDNFGHYNCSHTGSRVCLSGWQGEYCTNPRCLPGCDSQHGYCRKPNECTCHSGWSGPLCNQCERYPGCVHGTCQMQWECLCDEGWGGLFCNQDLNYCTNHRPCRNGGTCFNTGQGSYTCKCPPGYDGIDCERKLDDCLSGQQCLNGGTCRTNGTHHQCICPRNWHGPHCDLYEETCENAPCHNGGMCTTTANGYRCTCPPGFGGTDCDQQISVCSPIPCQNGGSCIEQENNFQCICPSGFSGDRCEVNIDDCTSAPCMNGGTCVDQVNAFRCQCVAGFVGRLCEEVVDYCLTKPCANGGTCQRLTNNFQCQCKAGFTGNDCSIEVEECKSQPCQNGGTCVDRVNNFECLCPTDFTGRTCSERSDADLSPGTGNVSAIVSPEKTGLTTEHVVVIATLSTFVPLLVLIGAVIVMCLKQRRKREQARADEEARMQNEQNTVHSSMAKRVTNTIGPEPHIIKNSWGKCTNNVLSAGIDDGGGVSDSGGGGGGDGSSDSECFSKSHHHHPYPIPHPHAHPHPSVLMDSRPVYTLQRTRSHKQLNTETAVHRASALFVGVGGKMHECADFDNLCIAGARLSAINSGAQDKRISILSNTTTSSSLCNTSDSSLVKRPHDQDGVIAVLSACAPTSGDIFVIEEHFHRYEAPTYATGMYATEV